MLGAIIGDIVGSRYEFANIHTTDFELFTLYNDFTDDTICTIAIADALLEGKPFKDSLLYWCRKYPSPMGGMVHALPNGYIAQTHSRITASATARPCV